MARARAKPQQEPVAHVMGEIVSVDAEGRAQVRLPGSAAPVLARSTLDAAARAGDSDDELVGERVLLWLEDGDPSRPVIVGLVRERVGPEPAVAELKLDPGTERDVLVDGRRVVFDGKHEIVLRCGKSTIQLLRDGRVLIRGTHLVSRSTGPNKIKGSSINLN